MARGAIVLLLLLLVPSAAVAEAEKRIALLIGNQSYTSEIGRLANPHNDIALLEKTLKALGFEVTVERDASLGALTRAINAYARRVRLAGPNAVGFLYYSGHGAADAGINFLIPVDVKSAENTELWDQSLRLTEVTRKLKNEAGNATHFVVFDACRNNLKLRIAGSRALVQSKGFVPVTQETGMLIAYATAEGELASDLGAGAGPYAKVLAEEIVKPGVEAVVMFRRVQVRVRSTIGQEPWLGFSALGEVHFAGVGPPLSAQPDRSELERAWKFIKETEDQARLEEFIRQFGDSPYAAIARARIDELSRAKVGVVVPPSPPVKSIPPTECDRLAASPVDTNAVAPGIEIAGIDHARAVPACEEAIAKYPEVARLSFQLGRAYDAKGEQDRALVHYNKAIQLDPKHAPAYNNRGYVYNTKGDHDRAVADYSKAIEIDPKFAHAHTSRGYAYYTKGDYDRAIADCTKAIEIDPKHANAHSNRGYAYHAKGDHERAVADFTKAIEIDPNHAYANYGRGYAYYTKGDHDRAIADYTRAIKFNPKYADAYYARAIAYYKNGDHDRAIADYRRTLAIDPKHGSASAELDRLGVSK